MKQLKLFLKEYFNYFLETGYLVNRVGRWMQSLWIPIVLSLFLLSSGQAAAERLGFGLLLTTIVGFVVVRLVLNIVLLKKAYKFWSNILKKLLVKKTQPS
jgi:hypothetical protein